VLDHPLRMRPLFISKVNTVAQIVLAAVALAELGPVFPELPLVGALEICIGATTAASGAVYLVQWLAGTGKFFEGSIPADDAHGKGNSDRRDKERRRA
jgi:cardiolipin synthase